MNDKTTRSFAGQLKKAFVIVVLLPVLCIGGFWFYSVYGHVERQRTAESQNAIEQNYLDLIANVKDCESSMRYLAANYNLQNFLTLEPTNYLEMGRSSKQIGQLLYNILVRNPYFRSLTIYTDRDYRVLTNFLANSKTVEDEDWYNTLLHSEGTQWWSESDKYYLGIPIIAAYPNRAIGVIKMEIRPELFSESFRVFQNIPVHVEIFQNGELFYEYQQPGNQKHPKREVTKEIQDENWTIRYQVDRSYYTNYVIVNFAPVAGAILAVVLLCWFITMHFFKRLSGGLQGLVQSVEEAQRGNLDVQIQPSQFTELNILAQSIQSFLNRIKQLISQVYTKEIQRQELELNLLQAKMSPHFLYNNLSAINWIALENGEDKICEITTELATFYRTALNKGKNVDKLRVEMENIRAYLNLQLIAHEHSFAVSYAVDDALLDCEVPIFVLQPLVENALEHGVRQLRNTKGQIRISVTEEQGWIQMQVWDNGTELYQKIGEADLPIRQYGYGTGNTHKRIQILYGEKSGLTIHADAKGTSATILFCPKQRFIQVN